ncbi:hypothetical protein GCAAIG_09460 [Candidatus Electronema halotolerans]
MAIQYPENIQRFQAEYQELIADFENVFRTDGITFRTIALFLDEVKFFWLERLDVIYFELEELTETNSCFVLCGAIYLNISDYEHFYFKSLGDYHLLFDPFLKIEQFFRSQEDRVDSTETIEYFNRVFSDTIEILTHYQNTFFILPIRQLSVKDEEERHELLGKFFLNFLSSSFDKEFTSQDDFCHQYETFEQIENAMLPYVSQKLVFNEDDSEDMSLREKLERHCNTQMNFLVLAKEQSEPQIFLIALYSWVSQIMDVLLICLYLRIIPYIRFGITFRYLVLIMYTFIDDQTLREVIEKTIVFYIFRKATNVEIFENRKFSEYSMMIHDKNVLANILDKMKEQQIDIFHGGIKQVEAIIQEEFAKYRKAV